MDQLLPQDLEQSVSPEDKVGTDDKMDRCGSIAQPDADDEESDEDAAPDELGEGSGEPKSKAESQDTQR